MHRSERGAICTSISASIALCQGRSYAPGIDRGLPAAAAGALHVAQITGMLLVRGIWSAIRRCTPEAYRLLAMPIPVDAVAARDCSSLMWLCRLSRIVITDLSGRFLDAAGGNGGALRDGGFEAAALNRPQGLAYHAARDCLYVADTENNALREVCCLEGLPILVVSSNDRASPQVFPAFLCGCVAMLHCAKEAAASDVHRQAFLCAGSCWVGALTDL